MDSSNKQRLVGVMVLIALATIVLPIVFHQSSHRNLALSIPQNAPPPPPLPDIQIAPSSQNTSVALTEKMNTPEFVEQAEQDESFESVTQKPSTLASQAKMTDSQQRADNNSDATESLDAADPSASSDVSPDSELSDASDIPKAPVIKAANEHRSSKPSTTVKKIAQSNSNFRNRSTASVRSIDHSKISRTTVPLKKITIAQKTAVKPNKISAPSLNKAPAIAHDTIAWDLQLGSFSDQQNAKKMVDKLREHGFKAYTKIGSNSNGKATRVCIGPELNRDTADSLARKLETDMHIKAMVIKHQI